MTRKIHGSISIDWPLDLEYWPLFLVKLPSLPVRWFFFVETFLAYWLRLFLPGFENPFFVAAYALVGVQAFEDEFGRGNLLLCTFFL